MDPLFNDCPITYTLKFQYTDSSPWFKTPPLQSTTINARAEDSCKGITYPRSNHHHLQHQEDKLCIHYQYHATQLPWLTYDVLHSYEAEKALGVMQTKLLCDCLNLNLGFCNWHLEFHFTLRGFLYTKTSIFRNKVVCKVIFSDIEYQIEKHL